MTSVPNWGTVPIELGEGKAAILVDQLQEAWQTLDMLSEYLLPETVISLLLAQHMPGKNKEPTMRLDLGLREFFALKAAVSCYETLLRRSDVGEEEKLALCVVERLHQRLFAATVHQPQEGAKG